jgi:CHAT domain-containing protein/tetratricopeptide (TPR) repeat protein
MSTERLDTAVRQTPKEEPRRARHAPCTRSILAVRAIAILVALVLALPSQSRSEELAPTEEAVDHLLATWDRSALEAARSLLARAEAEEGPASLATGRALRRVARGLRQSTDPDRQRFELLERSIAIAEGSSTDPSCREQALLDLAEAWLELGLANLGESEYESARHAAESATEAAVQAGAEESELFSRVLTLRGRVQWKSSELDKATETLSGALDLLERIADTSCVPFADTLEWLAAVLKEKGDFDGSVALSRRSLAICEAEFGPDHFLTAGPLNGLGLAASNRGDYATARSYLERVLAIRERTLGENHLLVGQTLTNLGTALAKLYFPEAWQMLERALRITERLYGPDHPNTAIVLGNLSVEMVETDPLTARRNWERVLSIFENAFGPNHDKVGWALSQLGRSVLGLGDTATAVDLMTRSVDVLLNTTGPDNHVAAWAQQGLANALAADGQPESAAAVLRKMIARADDPAAHPGMGVNYALVALAKLSEPSEAVKLLERALAVQMSVQGEDYPDVGATLGFLAAAQLAAHQPRDAHNSASRGLAILEARLGPNHPELIEPMVTLARAQAAEGNTTATIETALRAEALRRDHLRTLLRGMHETQGLRLVSKLSGLDVALATAAGMTAPDVARLLDTLVRSRALVQDEMAQRARAATHMDDPALASSLLRLSSARGRLANLSLRQSQTEDLTSYRAWVEDAAVEKHEAELAVAMLSRDFRRAQESAGVGLDQVRIALPPRTSLVSYVRYRSIEIGGVETRWAYAVFVLSPGHEPAFIRLGLASEIDALVSDLRRLIAVEAEDPGRSPRRSEAAYRQAGDQLRRRVWDPIASLVAGEDRVLLVPDGELALVSFAALPANNGYLIETGPTIHYLSAERDVVLGDLAVGHGLLALGDPSFDRAPSSSEVVSSVSSADDGIALASIGHGEAQQSPVPSATGAPRPTLRSACPGVESLRFAPLPETAGEIDEVASLWSSRSDRSEPGDRADVLRLKGNEADEHAFKQAAVGRQVVHLATHGFLVDGSCRPQPKPGVRAEFLPPENPMLTAGLALAGANQFDIGSDGEDGLLTAEEVASLDLEGVQWVVLSACESAAGTPAPGEGLLGLRRAFTIAGARTMIASLWRVEDQAARDWVRELYRSRGSGVTTGKAVERASLALLEARREAGRGTHPFYWGGFIASGDWR